MLGSQSALKFIILYNNVGITDNVMLSIRNALAENNTLRKLEFGGLDSVTEDGLVAFLRILSNPQSALGDLVIRSDNFTDNALVEFGVALGGNTTLEYFDIIPKFKGSHEDEDYDENLYPFSPAQLSRLTMRLLCNTKLSMPRGIQTILCAISEMWTDIAGGLRMVAILMTKSRGHWIPSIIFWK